MLSHADVTGDWFPAAPALDATTIAAFQTIAGVDVLEPSKLPSWCQFFTCWAGYIQKAVERSNRRPLIGVCGSQGSGKSTTTSILATVLRQQGVHPVVLSIDDFYLPRMARRRLADSIHPLLFERGMPGSHDIALLNQSLDQLLNGELPRLPIFDKGIDDRLEPSSWRSPPAPADVVLLEGWCVGCPPQPESALTRPLNKREKEEDPDGRWRHFVNAQLRAPYAELWARLDQLHLLLAPAFDQVYSWRDQQEQANRDRRAARAMSSAEVRRYVSLFQRLTEHMLQALPAAANLFIELDKTRLPAQVAIATSR